MMIDLTLTREQAAPRISSLLATHESRAIV
jgi:hypothetical protein